MGMVLLKWIGQRKLECAGNSLHSRSLKVDLYRQMMYSGNMRYEWDPRKNEWLKRERNISFEKILFHLAQGDVWRVADHPDQANYPGQKIYFVLVDEYIYLVPHVVEKDYIVLKTIIPSRKATMAYKREKKGG
jgi:hypothetical protein